LVESNRNTLDEVVRLVTDLESSADKIHSDYEELGVNRIPELINNTQPLIEDAIGELFKDILLRRGQNVWDSLDIFNAYFQVYDTDPASGFELQPDIENIKNDVTQFVNTLKETPFDSQNPMTYLQIIIDTLDSTGNDDEFTLNIGINDTYEQVLTGFDRRLAQDIAEYNNNDRNLLFVKEDFDVYTFSIQVSIISDRPNSIPNNSTNRKLIADLLSTNYGDFFQDALEITERIRTIPIRIYDLMGKILQNSIMFLDSMNERGFGQILYPDLFEGITITPDCEDPLVDCSSGGGGTGGGGGSGGGTGGDVKKNDSNTGLIIGLSVGGGVLLIIIAIIVYLYYIRRR
jgi:hypothetical protein